MDYSNKKIYWAAVAVRIILGVVFIYAAYVKLKEPWELFARPSASTSFCR